MFWRNLIFMVFLTGFNGFGVKAVSGYFSMPDTILAGRAFRIAKQFQNNADYDSALYYYGVSARAYGKRKNINEFLECRNNILTVKRNAGETQGLLKEAFSNLNTSLINRRVRQETISGCYTIIGRLYLDSDNQDSALYFFRKALILLDKNLLQNKETSAEIFRNMAVAHIDKGTFDSASFYIRKSTSLISEIYGNDHPGLAGNYNLSGTISYYLGMFDECREYFSKVVNIREKYSGLSHPLTAEAYNNLAVVYYSKGIYDSALILNKKALEIRILKLPRNHPNIALSLNNIGNIYLETGKFEMAADYHIRALEIRKKIYNTDNSDIAMSYANLGVLNYKMGRYKDALEYFLKFLQISEKVFGPDNPHTSDAYNNVGDAYFKLGDSRKSLLFSRKALAMRLTRGDSSPGVPTSYNNLGIIYKSEGDYDLALSCFRKSIGSVKKLQGNSHPDLVGNYNNTGEVYMDEGNLDSAIVYLNMAIDLGLRVSGADVENIASAFLNRGVLYGKLNEPDKEITDYRTGLSVVRKALTEEHPVLADLYNAMSGFLAREGKTDSSLIYQTMAIRIREKSYSPPHPVIASSYRDMALSYQKSGRNDSARANYMRSLQVNYSLPLPEGDLNPSCILDHNEFALTILELCRLDYKEYLLTGEKKLLSEITGYFDLVKFLVNSVISDFVLEERRIKLLNRFSKYTAIAVDAAFQLFINTGDPQYFAKALEFSELNKSAVLNNLEYRYKTEKETRVPERLLHKRKNLLGYTDFLRMKLLKPDREQERNSPEVRHRIDSLMLCLRDVNDTINQYTLRNFYPFAAEKTDLKIKIESAIEARDAFISYFFSDSVLFSFVITRDTSTVLKKIIPNGKNLKLLVKDYLAALKKYETERLPDLNSALYNILFKDVEKLITSKEKLVIIPDKDLFFLPFETLCDMHPVKELIDFTNQDFMIRKYDLVYHYSAGLWLSASKAPFMSLSRFTAFAPVFTGRKEGYLSSGIAEKAGKPESIIQQDNGDRIMLNELPYSLAEVDTLKKLFSSYGFRADIFTSADASEEALKENMGTSDFIHLATHGVTDNMHPELSGLAFSGNSQPEAGDSPDETNTDGILYAKDLYSLETHADLVTLSACETGTRKLEEGEGIIGLVRGFLSTGAKNILFSYWKVDDKSTLFFMDKFYRSALAGSDYPGALREAKLMMIKDPETSYPLIWGSFALIGH